MFYKSFHLDFFLMKLVKSNFYFCCSSIKNISSTKQWAKLINLYLKNYIFIEKVPAFFGRIPIGRRAGQWELCLKKIFFDFKYETWSCFLNQTF